MVEITTELILGILGTSTGVAGLILHFLKFAKERPKLKLEFFGKTTLTSDKRKIFFDIDVHNKGNLPTTVHKIFLIFNNFHKDDFKIETFNQKDMRWETVILPLDISSNKSISLHFEQDFQKPEIENFQKSKTLICEIQMFHTHGKITKIQKIY